MSKLKKDSMAGEEAANLWETLSDNMGDSASALTPSPPRLRPRPSHITVPPSPRIGGGGGGESCSKKRWTAYYTMSLVLIVLLILVVIGIIVWVLTYQQQRTNTNDLYKMVNDLESQISGGSSSSLRKGEKKTVLALAPEVESKAKAKFEPKVESNKKRTNVVVLDTKKTETHDERVVGPMNEDGVYEINKSALKYMDGLPDETKMPKKVQPDHVDLVSQDFAPVFG